VKTLAEGLATFTEQVGDDLDVLEINAAIESFGPETAAAEKRLDVWQKESCRG
jgi:hypothetical protein